MQFGRIQALHIGNPMNPFPYIPIRLHFLIHNPYQCRNPWRKSESIPIHIHNSKSHSLGFIHVDCQPGLQYHNSFNYTHLYTFNYIYSFIIRIHGEDFLAKSPQFFPRPFSQACRACRMNGAVVTHQTQPLPQSLGAPENLQGQRPGSAVLRTTREGRWGKTLGGRRKP